jgi:hypothetical protein
VHGQVRCHFAVGGEADVAQAGQPEGMLFEVAERDRAHAVRTGAGAQLDRLHVPAAAVDREQPPCAGASLPGLGLAKADVVEASLESGQEAVDRVRPGGERELEPLRGRDLDLEPLPDRDAEGAGVELHEVLADVGAHTAAVRIVLLELAVRHDDPARGPADGDRDCALRLDHPGRKREREPA